METCIEQLDRGEASPAALIGTALTDLIDELVVEVAFEVHRLVRLRMLCLCPAEAPASATAAAASQPSSASSAAAAAQGAHRCGRAGYRDRKRRRRGEDKRGGVRGRRGAAALPAAGEKSGA